MLRTVKIVFRAGAVLQINDVTSDVAIELVRRYRAWVAKPDPETVACIVGAVDQSAIDLREVVAIIIL